MGTRTVDLRSIHLEIAEEGAGGRPLMLVHGFTGAKEDFGDFLAPLAERGWHVVAPDLRGHGASDSPHDESAYSLPVFAGDLFALADSLGWNRFTLLGHSMGGMIAQHMLLGAPDRIEALILMDTAHGPLDGVGDPAAIERTRTYVRANGIPAFKEVMEARGAAMRSPADERVRAERPGYIEFGERKLLAVSPAMVCSVLGQFATTEDRLERLAAHTTPTLVIVGEQDRPFVGPSERMAEVMPGASLAVIPDGAHSPQFEAPDAWWAALTGFLDRVQEGATA
jgi:pimeloyl-ACP methyl ester carboxylesterase